MIKAGYIGDRMHAISAVRKSQDEMINTQMLGMMHYTQSQTRQSSEYPRDSGMMQGDTDEIV